MKNLLALALLLLFTSFVQADWTTDYKAALAQAKAQKKLILLDFTGSDWCADCKLLDEEVFARASFKDYANKNYILVMVDVTVEKQLPDDLKKQNDTLYDQFKVEGFPTLVVLDTDGKELGRVLGYSPGSGVDAVLTKLKSFSKD